MGQHFLRSPAVVARMVEAAKITTKDVVLEIGPGKGVLTKELARRAKKVIAVEKDPRLVEYLRELFVNEKNIEIIQGDILKINRAAILPLRYIVVANLPYYLTSRFLRVFLNRRPTSITVMIQKEVAQRIVARIPHMNLLALSVQAYGKAKIVFSVGRELFRPRPRVDSAVITITDISSDFFKKNKISEKDFFALARGAFQQKRKTLHNSIKVNSQKRPQELSLDDWLTLIKK